jgi:hypothetical protein
MSQKPKAVLIPVDSVDGETKREVKLLAAELGTTMAKVMYAALHAAYPDRFKRTPDIPQRPARTKKAVK